MTVILTGFMLAPVVAGQERMDSTARSSQENPRLASPEERISQKGFYYYNTAIVAEAVGDLNTAVDSYRRALQYFDDSYEVRYAYARVLYVARRYADAIESLRGITPEDGDVLRLRAAAYRTLGLVTEARGEYLKLVRLDSSDASVYSFLAVEYQQEGVLDSAAWALENLTRLAPDDYRVWVELGEIELDRGFVSAAKRAFDSSLALNSGRENLMTYVHLGEVYRMLNQPDSALQMFLAAHRVDPDNIVLNRVLSAHYIAVDSFGVALPYAQRLVAMAPGDLAGQKRLGLIYYVIDSLTVADSIFSALVVKDPDDVRNHYYLGRIAAAQQDYETARVAFEAVVAATDTLPEGYIDLGYVYRMLKDSDQEIAILRRGLANVSDSVGQIRLLMALGSAQEQNHLEAQARSTFEQLLRLAPQYAPALNYLGYMLADRGTQLEYAETLVKQAVDLDPNNPAYLDSYGWVRYRQGDFGEALIYLRQAAELDNDPTILDHLGDAFRETGDPDSARHYWQKALDQDPENEAIKEKLSD
ncbi:MAG: tetratricopeptide repeat protein [bacterium]